MNDDFDTVDKIVLEYLDTARARLKVELGDKFDGYPGKYASNLIDRLEQNINGHQLLKMAYRIQQAKEEE